MNGMEMMLKSMGIDVDAVKERVEEFQGNMANTLKHFDARLAAIEKQLAVLNEQMTVLVGLAAATPDANVLPAGKGSTSYGESRNGN